MRTRLLHEHRTCVDVVSLEASYPGFMIRLAQSAHFIEG